MPSSYIYQCLTKMTVFKKVLQGTLSHPHLVSSVGCEWYVTGMSSRLILSSNSDMFGYLREEGLFWARVMSAWGEECTALLLVVVLPFFHSSGTLRVPDSQCVDREITTSDGRRSTLGYDVRASVMSSLLKVPFWRCCMCLLYWNQAQGGVHCRSI